MKWHALNRPHNNQKDGWSWEHLFIREDQDVCICHILYQCVRQYNSDSFGILFNCPIKADTWLHTICCVWVHNTLNGTFVIRVSKSWASFSVGPSWFRASATQRIWGNYFSVKHSVVNNLGMLLTVEFPISNSQVCISYMRDMNLVECWVVDTSFVIMARVD